MTASPKLRANLLRRLGRWGTRWGEPGLENGLEIGFSAQMRRSVGRCYPNRGVIRLAARLLEGGADLLDEALAHEAAHIAVHRLYGPGRKPHGKEWQALMRNAGFEPRSKRVMTCWTIPSEPASPQSTIWVHRCPVCQMTRVAHRPIRAWLCSSCRAAGLDGRLEITSQPRSRAEGQ